MCRYCDMNICDLAIEGTCVCPVENCKKEFKSSSQLSMHVLRHHDGCKLPIRMGQGNEYYCPVDGCSRGKGKGQPFPRLGQLKQHYHSVHGSKEFSCERCGKSFGLRDVCSRHQAECGTGHQCLTCKDTFHSRNALYQHAKRKKHELPPGSKPRTSNSRTRKTANTPHPNTATSLIIPVTIKQVVGIPKQNSQSCEASTQTDPEPAPITTASQTSHFTQHTDASTQLFDIQLPNIGPLSDREVLSLDASTNTTNLHYPMLESSLDQLIDASTNTLPLTWTDPVSRVLVDAETSTVAGGVDEATVDLATQTNIADFLCDLSTQTEMAHVHFESHDINGPGEHVSHAFSTQSHYQSHDMATEKCYMSHDFAGGPDFHEPVNLDFPISTRDTSTSTSLPMVDYGVQTSEEWDEISQLLSKYDFGTQTNGGGCHGDVANLHQLSDLSMSTQTGGGMDSCTQTCLFSESGTQTLLGWESGTQT